MPNPMSSPTTTMPKFVPPVMQPKPGTMPGAPLPKPIDAPQSQAQPNASSAVKRAALRGVVHHLIKEGQLARAKTATAKLDPVKVSAFLKRAKVDIGAGPQIHAMKATKMAPKAKPSAAKQAAYRELFKQAAASPAAALGFMSGMTAQMLPSDAEFKKVAATIGLDAELVKAAYIKKKAYILPLMAGALGAGLLAPMAMHGVGSMMNPYHYWFGNGYRMSPENRALYGKVYDESMRSKQLSQNLQAISGAYNPAPNPWGNSGAMMHPMQ